MSVLQSSYRFQPEIHFSLFGLISLLSLCFAGQILGSGREKLPILGDRNAFGMDSPDDLLF